MTSTPLPSTGDQIHGMGLAIGGAIALALFLVGRNIVNTLGGDPEYAAEITRRIAAGNLTTDVRCAPGDKTACLPA